MIVERAEILHVAIPFKFAFQHALAQREVGDGLLLVLYDGEGRVGYGECTPRSYVSGETPEGVMQTLARRLGAWLDRRLESFEEIVRLLAQETEGLPRDEHAAACALELALLDLGGKAFGRSAGSPLGPVILPRVAYSGVISASGGAAVARACELMRKLGVTRAKVKVGGSLAEDFGLLTAARDGLGDGAALRVDANCAWDSRTALERLQAFEEFHLEGVEQPCAADDLEGMALVTAHSSVPVIADESLVSLADARALAAARACHVFNVRISKCGGLLSALRIRELGRVLGIGTMLGAHVGETAILAAAGRHFAARTQGLHFAEGSYGRLLLESDVSSEMDLEAGGLGRVPTGDGLGVAVDLEGIERFVQKRVSVDGAAVGRRESVERGG